MGTNYFRRDARDIEFMLFEHLDVGKLLSYEAYSGFSADDFKMIIDEAMKVARERSGQVDADSSDGIFYRGKVETAKYFCRNILTNVFARHMTLQQEDTSALDIPEEAF